MSWEGAFCFLPFSFCLRRFYSNMPFCGALPAGASKPHMLYSRAPEFYLQFVDQSGVLAKDLIEVSIRHDLLNEARVTRYIRQWPVGAEHKLFIIVYI